MNPMWLWWEWWARWWLPRPEPMRLTVTDRSGTARTITLVRAS
jgi:hypothetical protein